MVVKEVNFYTFGRLMFKYLGKFFAGIIVFENIKFNAAFKLASSHYMNGNYKDAAAYFKKALTQNPEDEDARHNYELALKTLEASEKKQKEQYVAETLGSLSKPATSIAIT